MNLRLFFSLLVGLSGSVQGAIGFRALPLTEAGLAPTRIHLWYPSIRGTGESATMQTYVGAQTAIERSRLIDTYGERGIALSPLALSSWLSQPMRAEVDADPSAASPLLIIGGGMDSPVHLFTRFAESMAARGYAVAVLPSFSDRAGVPQGFSSASFARQVKGIDAALRLLRQHPAVREDAVALGGWSVGGLAAFVVASKVQASAFVSLDSGFGYDYGVQLLEPLRLRPECFALPVLHITSTRPGRVRVAKTRSLFESLTTDGYWATIPGLSHAQFTDDYALMAPRADADAHIAGAQRHVEAVVDAFLRSSLLGNRIDLRSLWASETIEFLEAQNRPAGCRRPH
jgi:dienelactone hydrolase